MYETKSAVATGNALKGLVDAGSPVKPGEIHQSVVTLHERIRELHDRISGVETKFSPVCSDPSNLKEVDSRKESRGPSSSDLGRSFDQAITGIEVAMKRLEQLIDRSQV